MSGGRFEYRNDYLCNDIFGWSVSADYGLGQTEDYKKCVKLVRRDSVLEDKVISELVFDVFCLLHSFDWYRSGDTGEEDYRADVSYFKKKWLKMNKAHSKELVDSSIEDLKKELYTAFELENIDEKEC